MRHVDLESLIIELAQPIDRHLNPDRRPRSDLARSVLGAEPEPEPERKIGFLLCAFEFGAPGGGLAYLSNATKESLTPALQELLAKLAATGVLISIPRSDA